MPIYEYECPSCGVVEAFQGITEDPLTRCPECRRCKVRKLISHSSFHLKGSGWYATDYGKGNGGDNGKKEIEKKESSESAVKKESKDTGSKSKDTSSKSSEASSSTS
jgi:putative FmdB family regulatory protein